MIRDRFIALILLTIAFLVFSKLLISQGGSSIRVETSVVKFPPDVEKRLKSSTPSASFRVPILMYHYIEYVKDPGDTIRKSLDIVPFVFEKQLQTLKEAGYTFITPSQLSNIIDGKEELPPKPIILSFDDGYQDFYDNVFPLLKKYNIKVVAYIISGFLDKPNFMYSWEVQELAQSGLVEVGAHTVNHVYLKGSPRITAEYEIRESKKMLEELIGSPVVSFAYPSGAFDLQAETLVKNAGYKSAVSTVPGIVAADQDRFFLFRIRPGNRMGDELLNFLAQNSFRAY